MPPASLLHAPISPSTASTTCGGAPACRLLHWWNWRRPTPSCRFWGSNAVIRSGAIKGLRDEPLPLFAAASERESRSIAEQQEPDIELPQMTDGHNVIQDYSHTGLTLRQHPIASLRKDLAARSINTCEEAMSARDGRWLMTAGLVLVRRKPGSAKGVMFLTIEDETGPANVVA